jgi:hypothetical protein
LAPREPGSVSVTASADPLDAIPEGDETDNSATDAVTVQTGDLSISLTVSPNPVTPSDGVQWEATVANAGPAGLRIFNGERLLRFTLPAGFSNLAVSTPSGYSCFIAAANTIDCQTSATTTLSSGASVVITLSALAPSSPGTYTVTASADPLGVVPETDEADNSDSVDLTVA